MKFEEAFNAAFDVARREAEKKGQVFAVSPRTAKMLAFMWNMLAVAQNNLDNLCVIADDNSIVDIPLKEEKEKRGKKKQEQTSGPDGDATAKIESAADNGSENE